jgi:hypothetical protein
MTSTTITDLERNDLVHALEEHRHLLLQTVRGLTDAQARQTPTVSQLCLGGIIKHLALVEEGWVRFIQEGPDAQGPADEAAYEAHAAGFRMTDEDTLAALVARYEAVARVTDELVAALPSLDVSHPLPEPRGSSPGYVGQRDGRSCTSSPKRPNTPVMLTSSARQSTEQSPWAKRLGSAPTE